ncbi:MAG: NAD(P)H-dependent oxidoreductase subunit E [Alphaproteobacteria bacterium]|nr:NAD(P)H-dependent oxidoreductase subunit E [Alphaproteobacteria bacterium]
MKKIFDRNAPYQPESFTFRDPEKVGEILARYPKGRERSAIMPLLDLAQRQVAEDGAESNPPYGGWVPAAAMDEIARIVNEPPISVLEVASFYSMYHFAPTGKYLIQVCTTTPCWLRGSDDIVGCCKDRLGIGMGETTADGLFSLIEVECLGACVNAPMAQVNDDYYEDLTRESMGALIDDLAEGRPVRPGSQAGRKCSMAIEGPTTLLKKAREKGVA